MSQIYELFVSSFFHLKKYCWYTEQFNNAIFFFIFPFGFGLHNSLLVFNLLNNFCAIFCQEKHYQHRAESNVCHEAQENKKLFSEFAMGQLPFNSKKVVQNHRYENVFHLHVHFHENKTHFRMRTFAGRLVLRRKQNKARKFPIRVEFSFK